MTAIMPVAAAKHPLLQWRGRTLASVAVGLTLALGGCSGKKGATEEPEAGENLLGPSLAKGEGSLGGGLSGGDDLFSGGEPWEPPPRKKLPKPADPVERCSGKGHNRTCKMVDPKPKVSAAHGVAAMMGDFRWGMTPHQAFQVLAADIEKGFAERHEAAEDALAQDAANAWRREQLQGLKANHTKFTSGAKHRWGVSLIANEFRDDSDEEMLWVRNDNGLKKFYFFKDNGLWKIFYAYPTHMWPGEEYADVVEERFKKWFGASPDQKVKQDPKTAEPILRYYEWTSLDNEKIRAYDMTSVHGVIGLALVDGNTEARLGERLPITERKEDFTNVVEGVLGDSDVCYNDSGDVVECSR